MMIPSIPAKEANLDCSSEKDNVNPQYGRPQSMKLGGLLRGYHPARKCLKTGVG